MPRNDVIPFPDQPGGRGRAGSPDGSVQGSLALDLLPHQEPPHDPVRVPSARRDAAAVGEVVPIGVRRSREVQLWATRFAQAAVEIVGGDRPATQLVRWASPEVYTDLTRRAQLVARAGGHVPGQTRAQPVRPRVASVHTSFPTDDVAETAVHVRYGARSRALAARFEHRSGRWLCTALEFA